MIEKIKELYTKYGWIVTVVAIAAAAWSMSRPTKEIHTVTEKVDSKWKEEFAAYATQTLSTFKTQAETIVKTYQKNTDIAKDVNTTITETFDPTTGKLTGRVTTKIDKSTLASMATATSTVTVTQAAASTATSTTTVTQISQGENHTTVQTVTIKEKCGLLGFDVSAFSNGTVGVGPSINISAGTSVSPMVQGKVTDLKDVTYGVHLHVTP